MLMFLAITLVSTVILTLCFFTFKRPPKSRLYRFNPGADNPLPEARKNLLHDTFAARFQLNEKIRECLNDAETIDVLDRWVHSLWPAHTRRHSNSDNPLTIISRAKQGERFHADDYATVLAHAMAAVGIPTRLITLSYNDVAWRLSRSQYRGIEYFDRQQFKWVWYDGKHQLRITCNQQRLNCLELKQAALAQQLLHAEPSHEIDLEHYIRDLLPFTDIIIAQPIGQNRRYALVPPQLKVPRKKWLFGRSLFDVRCHSATAFYASHPIKQLTRPSLGLAINLHAGHTENSQ